jgi:hypothetical protein
VDNDISDNKIQIVDQPDGYKDSLLEIENLRSGLIKYESSLDEPITIGNKNQERYFSHAEAFDAKINEQEEIENELKQSGKLKLTPGQSYSFELESFCVQGRSPRPVIGDGLKIVPMQGAAKNYLPFMLEKYPSLNLEQSEMQSLIWGLLADVKYDQLSSENQLNLKRFYPDAEIRFGNHAATAAAKDVIDIFIPDEVKSTIDNIESLRNEFLNLQDQFHELENVMAPIQSRAPIPLGWMKIEEGYFVKVTAQEGYTKVKVEIYVPDELEGLRTPNSLKEIFFYPSELVALPGSGQRLALSPKKVKIKHRPEEDICEKLKRWKAPKCTQITESMREKILTLAEPKNFPITRYASPPSAFKTIEEETDCSHFSHEIYHRAGINFPYVNTTAIKCLSYFKEISLEEARSGDLILYQKHIGILSKNKKVISPGIGGTRERSKLFPNDSDFIPSIQELPIKSFGKPTFLRWSCQ